MRSLSNWDDIILQNEIKNKMKMVIIKKTNGIIIKIKMK